MKKKLSRINAVVNLKRHASAARNIFVLVLLLSAFLSACSGGITQEPTANVDVESSPTLPGDTPASQPQSNAIQTKDVQTSTPEMVKDTATATMSATIMPSSTTTSTFTATATVPITCPDPEGYLWSKVFSEDTSYIDSLFPLEDGNVLISGAVDVQDGTWVAKIDPEGNPIWQKIYSSSSAEMIPTANGNFLLRFYGGTIEINTDGDVVQSINIANMLPNADGSITVVDGSRTTRYNDLSTPLWSYRIEDKDLYGKPTTDGGAIYAYSGSYADASVYWQPIFTDIKVIKIDGNGTVRQFVYGKLVGDEYLDIMQPTTDGGAILAGIHYYEQLGLDYDIWLMKLNKSGGLSWQTTLRLAPEMESIHGFYTLSQGYLIVNEDYINGNMRLVKLAANGALSWQKEINSVRGNIIIDTAADTDNGGLIIYGHTAEKTEVRFLARFDRRGDLIWEKLIGFSGIEDAAKTTVDVILPLNEGNILLGGGTNLLGQGFSNAYGAWLANIEDEGEVLGFLTIFPGKFSVISTLSTRPNTLPDEVVDSDPIRVRDIEIKVEQVAFQALPACLSVGATLPTPQALPTLVPSPTPTPSFVRDLYLTSPEVMRGDDVLTLQLRLLELGYDQVGEADGVFGQMTEDAVRTFQEKNNLVVDGYVGPQTWNKLFSPSAQPNN